MHDNCAEDRIHYFECGYGPGRYSERDCTWTSHYVNDYDGPVMFKCGHNGFITGVKSHYNGGARDRRYFTETAENIIFEQIVNVSVSLFPFNFIQVSFPLLPSTSVLYPLL